jgi:hypothetical protein
MTLQAVFVKLIFPTEERQNTTLLELFSTFRSIKLVPLEKSFHASSRHHAQVAGG